MVSASEVTTIWRLGPIHLHSAHTNKKAVLSQGEPCDATVYLFAYTL